MAPATIVASSVAVQLLPACLLVLRRRFCLSLGQLSAGPCGNGRQFPAGPAPTDSEAAGPAVASVTDAIGWSMVH